MTEETELGWLRLTAKSNLVVTTLHVFQHEDRGIFGENQTIIPRSAITTVRIGWQRSHSLVLLGAIFIATYLVLVVSSIMAGPAGISIGNQTVDFSSSTVSFIQYGSLAGGIGLLVLFWFYKRNEIQIMAPSGTLGGTPNSFEEAEQFCSLLVPGLREPPATAKKANKEAESTRQAADREWHL
ncbi:MAG: hypothetical protein ACREQ7_22610 [Candidatus Binatia bacterium]